MKRINETEGNSLIFDIRETIGLSSLKHLSMCSCSIPGDEYCEIFFSDYGYTFKTFLIQYEEN